MSQLSTGANRRHGGGDTIALWPTAGTAIRCFLRRLIDPIDAQRMASQVIDYVAAEGTVSPKVEGRIKPM